MASQNPYGRYLWRMTPRSMRRFNYHRLTPMQRLLVGRPQAAPHQTWNKTVISRGFPDVPDGVVCDVTPAPGNTYTRYTWPPRGRGRGESLFSPRRIDAKLRARQVVQMRAAGNTWKSIATALGFKDPSGPYRAWKRANDRALWDAQQHAKNEKRQHGR